MASSEIFQQYNFSRYDEQPTKRNDPLDDARKRRTQEWAETVTRQLMKQAPSPNLVLQPSTSKTKPAKKKTAKRERRSKSFDFQLKKYHHVDNATGDDQQQKKTKEKKNEDEMFARMEERLQNLIQEGQAALSSIPEVYDMDEKEMAMRQAFAKRHST
ncbi:hypothetical protein DFQ28_011539 [Apophysomyces sp. BC1034]|nr:hypothetical protein DFQ29_006068 [Apophysomyces sp. BC1021]KAG0191563.1 hypothetical protein DFQ28_011539 [Apophysomyces sp. BC1034]